MPPQVGPERRLSEWEWIAAITLAGLAVGAGIGGSRAALLLTGLALLGVVMTLPLSWLIYLSLGTSLTFRFLTPNLIGPLSFAADLLIAVVVARVGMSLAMERGLKMPSALRPAVVSLAVVAVVMASSMLVNGDSLLALVGSFRQFLRFPLWAVALSLSGIGWKQGRVLLGIVLVTSLLQLPVALRQYAISGRGDPVSGTFGSGGSGVMMVFLVIVAIVWISLTLERATPAWTLFLVGPALVLPMALGSAALFVVLLPLGLVALALRAGWSRYTSLRLGTVLGGLVLLVVAGWTAGRIALAPGFAGTGQPAATAILSDRYLARYFATTGAADPGTRLGFIRFALRTNLSSGPEGVLLGQGPSASVIGGFSTGLKGDLGGSSALTTRSVQSFQRMLLGFGFLAPVLYALAILLPAIRLRQDVAFPGAPRALALALPVVAFLYLIVGLYNSAWSDPGLASAYWALVVAFQTAAHPVAAPSLERAGLRTATR